jgi:general secretion pathway protein E
LIKATVNGIMAQRLIRELCPHCKEKVDVDEQAWKDLVFPWNVAPPNKLCHPVGCLECRSTGYLGRLGIYEIMPLSKRLTPLITSQCDVGEVRDQSMKEGMHTLRLSGAQKVAAGLTSIEEVMRVAPQVEK